MTVGASGRGAPLHRTCVVPDLRGMGLSEKADLVPHDIGNMVGYAVRAAGHDGGRRSISSPPSRRTLSITRRLPPKAS